MKISLDYIKKTDKRISNEKVIEKNTREEQINPLQTINNC